VIQQLPADLAAAVLIVQHLAPTGPCYLAEILQRSARIKVEWAEQGARLERGHVVVAPPDVHLMIQDDHARLSGSARENHARPSIDKLFRSAAATRGSRVIGVLLTGMLDDGAAGLVAIQQAGGLVIVQDPSSAAFPDMPASALKTLLPDSLLSLDAIGAELVTRVGEPVQLVPVPSDIAIEAEIDRMETVAPERMHALGRQAPIACPECHGPMWALGDERLRRYRCYLGHAASARDLLDASRGEVESALWSAVRALNDRAMTLETLAADADHSPMLAQSYGERAREVRTQAELARSFMIALGRPPSP
jgi:two-component system chemotaxis response regulator CheB